MIVAFTTSCRPFTSAKNAMMSSGKFPNVTFRKPPMPGPDRAASSSVAFPMSAAGGMTAIADATKTATSLVPASSSTMAIGIAGVSR